MIRNLTEHVLSKAWKTLKLLQFEYKSRDGSWKKGEKEVYDTGDAAAVLLYHRERRNVLLNRQLRMPTYVNGNATGMLLEACAGKLDGAEQPEACIIREAEEETGYRLPEVQFLFAAYMAPGAITEKLYFFLAPYDEAMKVSKGGGLETEGEEIELLEIPFETAYQMIARQEIRDTKTIILLQHLKLHEAAIWHSS